MNGKRARDYAPWLWLLLGLFCFRVIAQLAVLRFDIPLLPGFDAWHGNVLPYPLLVAVQLVIVAICFWTTLRFSQDAVAPNRRLGRGLLWFAAVYAAAMLGRLMLGLTLLSNHAWFTHHLPTFFHLVLAAFAALAGHFHSFGAARTEQLHAQTN